MVYSVLKSIQVLEACANIVTGVKKYYKNFFHFRKLEHMKNCVFCLVWQENDGENGLENNFSPHYQCFLPSKSADSPSQKWRFYNAKVAL